MVVMRAAWRAVGSRMVLKVRGAARGRAQSKRRFDVSVRRAGRWWRLVCTPCIQRVVPVLTLSLTLVIMLAPWSPQDRRVEVVTVHDGVPCPSTTIDDDRARGGRYECLLVKGYQSVAGG
jgi:hypothetical protein